MIAPPAENTQGHDLRGPPRRFERSCGCGMRHVGVQIAARVVGSWIAASGMLLLALLLKVR